MDDDYREDGDTCRRYCFNCHIDVRGKKAFLRALKDVAKQMIKAAFRATQLDGVTLEVNPGNGGP